MNRMLIIGIAVLIILGIVTALFFLSQRSTATVSCAMTPQPTIVAFGDSLVEGYGASPGQDFVSQLSTKIGVPITNLGISGNTTADGAARVYDVLGQHPDIVIVLFGGNDALQKVPQATTEANLSKIIETLQSYQSKRVRVILVGVLGGFPSDPYASMFSNLSKKYQVTYVPNILADIITNQTRMYDQVHPNGVGYAKIADRLYPILENVCASK